MKIIKALAIILAVFWGFRFAQATAATLSLVPKVGQNFAVGREFTVELLLDSDVEVNAAQAVIRYRPEILKVVSVDRSRSIFNFWVEDPNASNGALSFIGGTSENISGKSLLIFTIRFKAVGAGKTDLTTTEGVVTASDGKGTNVLSTIKNTSITVSPTTVAPEAEVVSQPEKIVRVPVPATKLPIAPKLKVNLYPDPAKWYNQVSNFTVFWEVPNDVTQAAILVDQSPNTVPVQFDKELFNGKSFSALKEGVWYLHVRFRNNVGAGPTTHYRIAIDITSPLPFSIEALEGLKIEGVEEKLKTDNPQPLLKFNATDALSGISRYLVQIADSEIISLDKGEIKLPLQVPGQRRVAIKALDMAGNTREKILDLEILPIASPEITFLKKDIFVGEGDLVVRGIAQPEFIIKINVRKETGDVVAEATVVADKMGNWEAIIDQPLKKGRHRIEVVAQDQRGALSLPQTSGLFKVRERPLFTLAGIGITQLWFFVGIIMILFGGFAGGWFSYRIWRAQMARRVVVAQRDVVTAFTILKKELEKVLSMYTDKQITALEASEMEFLLRKTKENLEKMQKYIVENIEEISA